MIKKALIILFIVNSAILIHSCCRNPDQYNHIWTKIEISSLDISGELQEITNSLQLDKKNFGFRVSLFDSTTYYAVNWKLGNECYALSCDVEHIRIHDISKITVKTLYDYSTKYPSNSSVTELFRARHLGEKTSDYITISEMITSLNSNSRVMESPYKSVDFDTEFDLCLVDTTCIGGNQQFEVIINLSDETTLLNETDILNLN